MASGRAVEITEADLVEARQFIADDFTTEINSINVTQLAYEGFEPIAFLASLKVKANNLKVPAKNHASNLIWLATLGTMRGTNLEKIAAKSLPEAKRRINELKGVYALVSKPTEPQSASLGRIAACFVRQISKAIHSGKAIDTAVKSDEMCGVPKCFLLSSVGSLIPPSDSFLFGNDQIIMYGAFLRHQGIFNGIINPSSTSAVTDEIVGYAQIQFTSSLYSTAVRNDHWVDVDILTMDPDGYLVFKSKEVRACFYEAASDGDPSTVEFATKEEEAYYTK